MATITLREAIRRWQQEPHAPANAYDWYRRDAHRSGSVRLGALTIPAHKDRGTWRVESTDFDQALGAHREWRKEVERATADLRAGVLRGRDGDRVETEWGYYVRRDPFHFRWDAYAAVTRRSDGAWYCNTCLRPAETEHNAPECHRCSDWGSCGRDCTLSRVVCQRCGATMDARATGEESMYEPQCRIDWSCEGYQQVWLYDGTEGSPDDFRAFCVEVAHAIGDADTLERLSGAIDDVAGRRGLVARTYPGPSQGDPLRLYVTVGVFSRETAPKGW